MEVKYISGKAWKHHISENFSKNKSLKNGAGKGGTIFLNYEKMIEYLKKDGRDWHIAELELNNDPVKLEFNNDWMATILINKKSITGFMALKLF